MRAVIQRVKSASVKVHGERTGTIGPGLLVFLGLAQHDSGEDLSWLVSKLCGLRIFADADGKMNLDLAGSGGAMLVVSQFTLLASTRKGNRPSFTAAEHPEKAEVLYEEFVRQCGSLLGKEIQTGSFGEDMQVELVNDGPVTIVVDSRSRE